MISSEFIIVIFEPASPDDILVYSSLSGFMRISCNSAIELAVIEKNIIKELRYNLALSHKDKRIKSEESGICLLVVEDYLISILI